MKDYDEKCYELAEYFLPKVGAEGRAQLAQTIQDAIEDWLSENEAFYTQERPR